MFIIRKTIECVKRSAYPHRTRSLYRACLTVQTAVIRDKRLPKRGHTGDEGRERQRHTRGRRRWPRGEGSAGGESGAWSHPGCQKSKGGSEKIFLFAAATKIFFRSRIAQPNAAWDAFGGYLAFDFCHPGRNTAYKRSERALASQNTRMRTTETKGEQKT